jgi:hypothetical protein
MADEKPPIPFYKEESMSSSHDKQGTDKPIKVDKTDKVYQEFKRVDPNDNNNTTKIKIPHIGSSGSVEELLKVISHFKKAAAKLQWANGAKKFDNFELLLEGQMLNRWERIINANAGRSNDAFNACLTELIKCKCPKDDAFDIQQEHLRTVTKRRTITVADFAERLEDLNMYSIELPGSDNGAILAEEELVRILYRAMPKAWRDEFRKNNHSLNGESFASLRQTMMVYEEIMTPKQDKQSDKKSGNDSNKNHNNNGNNHNNRRGNRNNNNRNNNRNNNSNGNNNNNQSSNNHRCSNSDECPIHGKHKWGECIFNPSSNNYRPRNNNSNNGSTNNNNRNQGNNNRGDSHAANANNNSNNNNNNSNNNNRNNNNNNSNPQSSEQHHFELVPDSGIEEDWSGDNFLFNTSHELEGTELDQDAEMVNAPKEVPSIDMVPSTIAS